MKCDEAIRELAVPSDDRDPTALAEHLSACPTCAGWAREASKFDHLWQLTRPPEPAPEAWDLIWARVAAGLDASTPALPDGVSPRMMPSQNGMPATLERFAPSHRRSSAATRWGVVALVGLAQAAAVLLAVSLTWRTPTDSVPGQAGNDIGSGLATINLEIEEGHLVVIRWDGLSGKVEDRTPDISDGVDDWLLGLNAVEALADLSVAFKE
jgi:hypothetical protein